METSKDNKKKETLGKKLDDFLSNNQTEECVGEECLINDGKEIVERVEKVYKTNASVAPVRLKPTGSNLKKCGINSASMAFKLDGITNKAPFQKGEPKPINKSRDK